jgi:hypothetical protein
MTAVLLVSSFTSVAFLWYNVVGAATVFVAGLIVSALQHVGPPSRPSDP